jgi:pimeloyl-ACP methyl ester carboxylesterase
MRPRTALTALGLAGAGALSLRAVDRADRRRIAADPAGPELFEHPQGTSTTVTSADGTRLNVELFGPEDAPPVVLIHGWTCALWFWRLQIRDLMADHRVIAFDLRGHGESGSAAGGDWSPDALGDDLEAVLESVVGDRRALIAGHSLGAMTVVAWAGRHPESVERRAAAVALLNTGIGDLVSESLLIRTPAAFSRFDQAFGTALLGAAAPLPKRPDPITHRAIRYVALSPSASPAQVRFCEQMVLGCTPRVRASLGRELTHLDLREAIASITVPSLVVAGTADRLTPPVHAQRMVEALPGEPRLLELEGAGHMCPVERPREVTAALRELSRDHIAPTAATA